VKSFTSVASAPTSWKVETFNQLGRGSEFLQLSGWLHYYYYTLKWGVKKIAFIIDCYVPTPLNLSRRIENPESSRGGEFEEEKQPAS
jgi:hypothetical protein